MKEINVILGERVKTRRWELNMTRETLAEKIDVSPRFLADVESGKIGVSINTLKLLAKALRSSSDYLLGIAENNDKYLSIMTALSSVDDKYLPMIQSVLEELYKLS